MESFEVVYKAVKEELSEERFKHSQGVMERCIEFAKIYGADVEKAKLIGIAHDIAKEVPKDERVLACEKNGIELDDIEKENTSLIHAKLGAKICKDRFGFTEDMCEAIRVHTTGKANMSLLDKILYLSDLCEPSRNFDVEEIYELGKKDLDLACIKALERKMKYTLDRNAKLHPDSVEAYNSLKDNK